MHPPKNCLLLRLYYWLFFIHSKKYILCLILIRRILLFVLPQRVNTRKAFRAQGCARFPLKSYVLTAKIYELPNASIGTGSRTSSNSRNFLTHSILVFRLIGRGQRSDVTLAMHQCYISGLASFDRTINQNKTLVRSGSSESMRRSPDRS